MKTRCHACMHADRLVPCYQLQVRANCEHGHVTLTYRSSTCRTVWYDTISLLHKGNAKASLDMVLSCSVPPPCVHPPPALSREACMQMHTPKFKTSPLHSMESLFFLELHTQTHSTTKHTLGPCLVHPENQKVFKISRHIESCGTCMKH